MLLPQGVREGQHAGQRAQAREEPNAVVEGNGEAQGRIFLTRDQNYLCFREAGEPGRMLPSRTSDELKLAAHPVGKSLTTGGRRKPYIDGKGVHL